MLSQNDEQERDRITPQTQTVHFAGDLNYAFPNASVVVIQVPLSGR